MATDAAVGALPDELLLDIFQRLPDPVDVLRCVATCRRWLRAVAADDAAFLRRSGVLRENKKATILLGAFYQCQKVNGVVPRPADMGKRSSDCTPQCWSLDGLPPAVDRPSFGLFSIRPKYDGLFNYTKPLASRGGLLLVRLMPAPLDYRKLHLAVCHPLLGGVHHVPPPIVHLHTPLLGRDLTGYAVITGYGGECLDSHRHRQLAFRVLFTAVGLNGVVYAYSYSSATGRWSAPTICPMRRSLTMSGPRTGVVDGCGTTHWLYRDELYFYTLEVSADAGSISLTKIPILVEDELDRRLMQLHPPYSHASPKEESSR